ncbi:MAG: FAD-dependent oxidoreductase [Geminicoccaceae bacterium]
MLLAAARIIWPMRFVLPHSPEQRPAWPDRLGLFSTTTWAAASACRRPRPGPPKRRKVPRSADITHAFEYSDCWVDDARLVLLNALGAHERGARDLTRTACTAARREGDHWQAELEDRRDGSRRTIRARAIVNAAGPWVERMLGRVTGAASRRRVRLRSGQPHRHPQVLGRPARLSCRTPTSGSSSSTPTRAISPSSARPTSPSTATDSVAIDQAEIDYLLRRHQPLLRAQALTADIVATFSGVRPLYDDAAENPPAVTRDYVFDVEPEAPAGGQAPIPLRLRRKDHDLQELAEHALDKLQPFFPALGRPLDRHSTPAGRRHARCQFRPFRAGLAADFPWAPADLVLHYARLYGTRARTLLDGAGGGRSRPPFRRPALRARGRLSPPPRMGHDRRRYPRPAHQARPPSLPAERRAFAAWCDERQAHPPMPEGACTLGIDCGTSGLRGVVVDAAGTVLATAHRPFPAGTTDRPSGPGPWTRSSPSWRPWPRRRPCHRRHLGYAAARRRRRASARPLPRDDASRDLASEIATLAPPESAAHGATSPAARLLRLRSATPRPPTLCTGRLARPAHRPLRHERRQQRAQKLGWDPVERGPAWLAAFGIRPDLLPAVVEPGTVRAGTP